MSHRLRDHIVYTRRDPGRASSLRVVKVYINMWASCLVAALAVLRSVRSLPPLSIGHCTVFRSEKAIPAVGQTHIQIAQKICSICDTLGCMPLLLQTQQKNPNNSGINMPCPSDLTQRPRGISNAAQQPLPRYIFVPQKSTPIPNTLTVIQGIQFVPSIEFAEVGLRVHLCNHDRRNDPNQSNDMKSKPPRRVCLSGRSDVFASRRCVG